MDQRLSLIMLGVADTARARAFDAPALTFPFLRR